MRTAIALILLSISLQIHAESLAYRQAMATLDKGDDSQALTIFLDAAKQGDAWSQFGLGMLYLNGQGTSQDSAGATRWFQKAVNQGLAFAQLNLGNAYLHGQGIKPDHTKSAFWWQQAAVQGNANAQSNLGALLYFDYATTASKRLGKAWLQVAANQGDEAAQARLAQIPGAHRHGNNSIWELDPELSEVKILTMSSDHFSINLFTTKKPTSITTFLNRHNLVDQTSIYRSLKDDSVLYNILYGSYSSREDARKALLHMHPELLANDPWPVALNSIQNRIRSIQTTHLDQKEQLPATASQSNGATRTPSPPTSIPNSETPPQSGNQNPNRVKQSF